MTVTVRPFTPRGTVTAPPSKSAAHRLLVCAGLAAGESVIENVPAAEDAAATLRCLTALGAAVTRDGATVRVRGTDPASARAAVLDCGESGSTLRFLTPLCLVGENEQTLTGSRKLLSRPLAVYETLCREKGLAFRLTDGALSVKGPLSSGAFTVPGNVSSQFVSGLLFALPLLAGDSTLTVTDPIESRPYIDMTLAALRQFGVTVRETAPNAWLIPGGQRYRPQTATVEGDCSGAAFFEALNFLGGDVTVAGLAPDTLQGDRVFSSLAKRIVCERAPVDLADCPDLAPVLFAVAAATGGGTFTGTRRLADKESDRARVMQAELAKFGAAVTVEENRVRVTGGTLHAPTEPLCGHNDHRVVMALAVLACKTGGTIVGAEAVAKSFPNFFELYSSLGTEVLSYGMDQ